MQIFAKPLADGAVAVAFLNRGAEPVEAELRTTEIGIATPNAETHDLWTGQVSRVTNGTMNAQIASHSVVMLRIKYRT